MSQTTISQYFTSRKRPAADGEKIVNQSSKVLIIETGSSANSSDVEIFARKTEVTHLYSTVTPHDPKKTIKFNSAKQTARKLRTKSAEKSSAKKRLFKSEAVENPFRSSVKQKHELLCEVRGREPAGRASSPCPSPLPPGSPPPPTTPPPAPVQLSEPVVPPVHLLASPAQPTARPPSCSAQEAEPAEPATPNKTPADKCTLRKELGLGQLKSKLCRSERLAELKSQLAKVNKGYDKLAQLSTLPAPTLTKFDHIELQVTSPVKIVNSVMSTVAASPLRSPAKESVSKLREAVFRSSSRPSPSKVPYVSPRKLLEENRGSSVTCLMNGAYERFAWLAASSGKPCLPLPYSYKLLGEMFRAVEVVSAMLYNRNETVTFDKLKQSSQELTSKRLSPHHLGQMLTIFPGAFSLAYEKLSATSNNHQLIVRPNFKSEDGKLEDKVTPSMQLERRRKFFSALLEVAKSHHERFLLSLDPPLNVPKDKLTRWHPGFVLDSCPDVEPAPIPEPPVQDTTASAKQLLSKAKELFIMNPRMEKALAELSKSDSSQPEKASTSAAAAIPALTNALKNIPKALLEKVRARQAAKAVEFLTKDPEKSKREVELARLPQMSRILRNLYVAEKKNVLDRPYLLDKLSSSFRENLPPKQMDHHLQLLIDRVPGWLTVHRYGQTEYVRLDKGVQLSSVIEAIQRASSPANM